MSKQVFPYKAVIRHPAGLGRKESTDEVIPCRMTKTQLVLKNGMRFTEHEHLVGSSGSFMPHARLQLTHPETSQEVRDFYEGLAVARREASNVKAAAVAKLRDVNWAVETRARKLAAAASDFRAAITAEGGALCCPVCGYSVDSATWGANLACPEVLHTLVERLANIEGASV